MLLNLWCPMTSKWGMTQLPPFILFLFCFPSDPSFLLLLPLPSGERCPSWIKARFGLKSLRNIGIVMGEKEAHFTLRMVNGFCKLRNALSASKVRDFKRLPLSQLFLHNLTSERKVLQSLSVTVGRCYWWFFSFLFFKISWKTDCLSVAFLYFADDEMCCNKTWRSFKNWHFLQFIANRSVTSYLQC